MKILIIDDDLLILSILEKQLKHIADEIVVINKYENAEDLILTKNFDVIVCDHRLSNESGRQGLDLIKKMRAKKIHTPILLLTGRNMDEITPWDALDSGSDDFLKKPYRAEELIARIKLIYRRNFKFEEPQKNIIKYKNIHLDVNSMDLIINKRCIKLGRILFLLMLQFLKRPYKLMPNKSLVEYLWGKETTAKKGSINSLRVYIHNLKNILGKNSGYIRSMYSCGYVFDEKVK